MSNKARSVKHALGFVKCPDSKRKTQHLLKEHSVSANIM